MANIEVLVKTSLGIWDKNTPVENIINAIRDGRFSPNTTLKFAHDENGDLYYNVEGIFWGNPGDKALDVLGG